MLLLICISLGLAALYGGGMWLFMVAVSFRNRAAYQDRPDLADRVELGTFHLGLCFIHAVGFLGIILAIGG